tara:strand:+ start:593 stop:1189 length:597 start_codon:yes stop_codon:yes gene_type:complete
MAEFGKKRFPKGYQKLVGMDASRRLHDNSKELVQVLIDNDVFFEGMNVFELGAGPARNLKYINDVDSSVNLYCNDLWQEESVAQMSEEVRNKIHFYEMDSLNFLKTHDFGFSVDLFVCSDHLMHIPYNDADQILRLIRDKHKPKYIIFREIRKEFETPNHPRLFHNYDLFSETYNTLCDKLSRSDNKYFIRLLKQNEK